jgi:hypothetical protein
MIFKTLFHLNKEKKRLVFDELTKRLDNLYLFKKISRLALQIQII